MRLLLLLMICGLMMSCGGQRELLQSSESTSATVDSFVHVDIVRIDTIKIPQDTLLLTLNKEVFVRDTIIRYRNGRVSTKIVYKDGNLTIGAKCDSLEKLVLSRNREIKHLRSQNTELKESSKETITKPVRWYYKAGLFISISLLVIALVFAAVRILLKSINPL